MRVPTINLNGTDQEELREEVRAAYDKLGEALAALRVMTVHGRDYHMQGQEAIHEAQDEHRARINAVFMVRQELLEYFAAIDKQPGRKS